MKLLKDIMRVAFSNVVGYGTSFIINFLLPAILSVADYGNYKQYTMYISLTYLFNLGYNDGIFIKYGGKNEEDLDPSLVRSEHTFVIIFQLLMFVLMFSYALFQSSLVLAFFSLATLFDTINSYHGNFMQASGQFASFSRGNILKSIFNVILLLVVIFIFRADHYVPYIIVNLSAFIFLTVYFESIYIKKYGIGLQFDFSGKLELFKVGFFILISNISLTFVGNVGSWVVNARFPIEIYAQYAFQASLLNVILLVVNAIGMVFYNLISKRSDQELLNMIKKACLYLGIGSGLAFFIFKWIITHFLPQYVGAISLLSVTFMAIPYIMLSRILIANLYKTQVSEKIYFRDSVLFAGLSFIFVLAVSFIFESLISVAFATTLSYMGWFIYTTVVMFPKLKSAISDYLVMASHILFFYLIANYLPTIPGFFIYGLYLLLLVFVRRNDFKNLAQIFI